MATLRNDIGIFCLVDKFNHHYLLNLDKDFEIYQGFFYI